MPKHIVRLLILLVGFLAFAYAGIVFLTDPSFYRFGHYRADSVPELAAGTPRFKGPQSCQECHAERHAEWTAGSHANVKCEVCHGPSGDHPESAAMLIPDDPVRLCSTCHEAMPSRPAAQPQVVVAEHPYPQVQPIDCTTCHNAHSPGIQSAGSATAQATDGLDDSGAEPSPGDAVAAAAPPSAASCAACHGRNGEGMGAFPPIAGMDAANFAEQMNRFRSGDKPSPLMQPVAQALSDAEIGELAKYYAGLNPGTD